MGNGINRSSRPGNKWLADHRRAVRFVLLAIDAALVVYLVLGTVAGGLPWYAYLQLLVWASITTTFGWFMPSSVDRWRLSQHAAENPPDNR